MTGFYKAYRLNLQPQNSRCKFSIEQAYHWLAKNAAWADHKKKIRKDWYTIRKGFVLISMRDLAKKWNRHRSVIRSYLLVLKSQGVIKSINYSNKLKLLEIQVSEKVYQSQSVPVTTQLVDNSTTIPNNRTHVLEKSVPVNKLVTSENLNNLKLLTHLSTVVYKKEEEFNTEYNKATLYNNFNTLETNYMTLRKKPDLSLVQPSLDFGSSEVHNFGSQTATPSSADLCSKNIATAGTKKPPSPLKSFLPSTVGALPYPRNTDSPVLLTNDDVHFLEEQLGKACLRYQVEALAIYALENPAKFKKYQNHRLVILRWDRMKTEKGLMFCAFHSDRPGYYPKYIYEAELENHRSQQSGLKLIK